MARVTRTMGVDQVPSGLEVAVLEDGDAALFGGRVGGTKINQVTTLATLVEVFEVQRGLIDPRPDAGIAADVLRMMPQVFSIEESAGSHNAASLAQVAYRRMEAMREPLPVPPGAPAQVATLAPTPHGRGAVVGVYVPPGEPIPTHAIIPLEGGVVLDRPDGAKVVERTLGLHEVALSQALPAQVMGARSVWTLAPTTQLPTKGWTLVVSVYAGDGSLMHEQVLTEGQLLGIENLVPEATMEAAKWLETAALPPGPYTARFEIFAAQASVYVNNSVASSSDPSGFAAALHDTGVVVSDWIVTNAVDVEIANPGVNIPAPEPFELPDISKDTYDYPIIGG